MMAHYCQNVVRFREDAISGNGTDKKHPVVGGPWPWPLDFICAFSIEAIWPTTPTTHLTRKRVSNARWVHTHIIKCAMCIRRGKTVTNQQTNKDILGYERNTKDVIFNDWSILFSHQCSVFLLIVLLGVEAAAVRAALGSPWPSGSALLISKV